jgi:SAM-dependent methyltransferase
MVGAGTGLDLDFVPSNVHVTAIDVTPAMLRQLKRRAAGFGRAVTSRTVDARQPAFPDSSFDAVVKHLILALMPQPERGSSEAVRVVKRGGRIPVFDTFPGDEERPSLKRRLLNAFAKPLCSDMNRRLGPLIAGTPLVIEQTDGIRVVEGRRSPIECPIVESPLRRCDLPNELCKLLAVFFESARARSVAT